MELRINRVRINRTQPVYETVTSAYFRIVIMKPRTRMGDHDEHSPPEADEKQLDKSQVFASIHVNVSRRVDGYKNIAKFFFSL